MVQADLYAPPASLLTNNASVMEETARQLDEIVEAISARKSPSCKPHIWDAC